MESRKSSGPSKLLEDDDSSSSNMCELYEQLYPVIRQSEVSQVLPKYTTILSSAADSSVRMEDLDEIQQDLEKLLSICAIRHRLLKSKAHRINRIEKKKKRRKPNSTKFTLKRRQVDRRLKGSLSRILKQRQTSPVNAFVEYSPTQFEPPPQLLSAKYDVLDNFWSSVEPYCGEVTNGDAEFLNGLIAECSASVDFKIPELGEHYTSEWVDAKRNQSPLTQRLFDILLEEKGARQTIGPSRNNNVTRVCSPKSGLCLDVQLRKELIRQGILDADDVAQVRTPDDEILKELEANRRELAALNKYNVEQLEALKVCVDTDLQKQQVKVALEKVDNEVINVHKRPLTKELEEEAANLIKHQQLLHGELTKLTNLCLME